MPRYTQANRPQSVSTPLAADVLLLQRFSGNEAISKLFLFELDLLAESAATIAFDAILGQGMTVTLTADDGSKRYFNGIVSRFSQGGRIPSAQGGATFTRYRAEVVPDFWLLTRNHQSRIFQQKTVPDILKAVLGSVKKVTYRFQNEYLPRDYCVQYRETDFAFASRLMEEEGIFYFFKHADGSHEMVVTDMPQGFSDVPGVSTLIYETLEGGTRPEDRIHGWQKSQELRSANYRLWDSCFEKPGENLESVKPSLDSVQVGTVSHKLKVGVNNSLEIYDYPGGYAQRFDGVEPGGGDRSSDLGHIGDDGKRTVGIRIQEETASAVVLEGRSTCRQLASGCKFTLTRHFDGDGAYVLTRLDHLAEAGDAYTLGNEPQSYTNTFQCIPSALPYRPQRTIPRPRIDGTQTAVVVGNKEDEIFTDKYGRIKVQFPWDRQGQNNADSSCWIRVASPWAGAQWGMIHIPRVGQEVVIAFEEGDPDRPIIVGSVYNFAEMPPYKLPDNMTQSGYLGRSSKKGTAQNFNQLRFEDKKDSEEVYFHAEKDFNRVVENNDTLKVGADKKDKGNRTVEIYNNHSFSVGTGKAQADDGSQTIAVFNNQTLTVGDSQAKEGSQTITIYKDRTETVKTGNESVTIEKGNRTVTVKTGNDTHEVSQGNRAVTIDMGNDTLTIKMGNQATKVNLGASSTEAMQSIELKVGANSIKIDQSGITLKGIIINAQAQAQAQVKGPIVMISADGMAEIKGGIVMIN